MGAMSSIRFLPDGEHFITVMDTGYWAQGKIIRGKAGKLQAISDFSIHEMIGPPGYQQDRKGFMDAEGLVLDGNDLLVSFEHKDRIDRYPLGAFEASSPLASQKPHLVKGQILQSNGGMEALLRAPLDGPLAGSLIFVSEKTYNDAGDFIAGVQSGPKKGSFFIKREPPYNITDGVFLPDGSFLLLERSLGLTSGIGVRVRRFGSTAIEGKGETIDGVTIFEAGYWQEIDNMEGIDVIKAPEGDLRIILISDDNHSMLERNLMLEFRLLQ